MTSIQHLIRKNIRQLQPYTSTRNELNGRNLILLDANENSMGSPIRKWYHRYPDPLQTALREKIATIKNVPAAQILLGNGSDECIDLLMRVFCEPGKDQVIITPPTFEMYSVYAQINNVPVKAVPLTSDFQLDLDALEGAVNSHSKMIFLCSPNSPTGNNLYREDMEVVLNNFPGIVVVDEAYINYSRQRSFLAELADYPNLVVLQTFSKAWGLAGLRVGMAMASMEIIETMNRIRPPYNVTSVSQELVTEALDQLQEVNAMILQVIHLREGLEAALKSVPVVSRIYPSDANFLLVQVQDAPAVHAYLKENGVLVSDKSGAKGCENCLRISVGTEEENGRLVQLLRQYK